MIMPVKNQSVLDSLGKSFTVNLPYAEKMASAKRKRIEMSKKKKQG